LDKQIYEIF